MSYARTIVTELTQLCKVNDLTKTSLSTALHTQCQNIQPKCPNIDAELNQLYMVYALEVIISIIILIHISHTQTLLPLSFQPIRFTLTSAISFTEGRDLTKDQYQQTQTQYPVGSRDPTDNEKSLPVVEFNHMANFLIVKCCHWNREGISAPVWEFIEEIGPEVNREEIISKVLWVWKYNLNIVCYIQ